MADTDNNTANNAAESKAPKAKTVNEDLAARRTFYPVTDSEGNTTTALEQALEYVGTLSDETTGLSDFGDFPFCAPGMGEDEDGDTTFDESIYTDDTGVMVGTLKKNKEGVKAIFMAPIPNLRAWADSASEDKASADWILGILEKEANHVAVRPLRDAEDFLKAVPEMPTSVDAYTNSGRAAGAGIMAAFNELYKSINATLAAKSKPWARARLVKAELKKAMESSAYALEYYAGLEDRGEGKPSLFVLAINMGISAAKKKGYDPAGFERWLATRDQKPLTAATDDEDEDEDDLDLDTLTESLLSEPAADGETTEAEADTDSTDAGTAEPEAETPAE